MRIRYSFTSDLSEVMAKVIFNLKHFKQNKNLEKQFTKVVFDLSREEVNHTHVVKQISELREELSKLDLLLLETAEIVTVCQQGLVGQHESWVEDPQLEEEPQSEEEPPTPPRPDPRQTSEAVQAIELQNAFKNIQNITGELKKIKNKNV